MCVKSASDAFEQARTRLAQGVRVLVVTHARPDGDALGSAVALATAGRAAGKEVQIIVPDVIPGRYEFLFDRRRPAPPEQFDTFAARADVILVLDTCAHAQLDELAGPLGKYRQKTVVVDHHATRDDVGAVQWVDTSAAATGVMVCELLGALGWALEPTVVEALMVAITSDTGWLRFANTDGRALRAVALLVDEGARPDEIYAKLHESDSIGRLRLLQRMLGSLELHSDDKLAVMTLLKDDFAQAGAAYAETENLVNEAFRLKSVEAVILLVEMEGAVRISLRSNGGVDVAELAERFGGGGHARAAGARITDDIDLVKQRFISAVDEELRSWG